MTAVSPSSAIAAPKKPPLAPSLALKRCVCSHSEPVQEKEYTTPTAPDRGPSVESAPTRIVSPSIATATPKASKLRPSLARSLACCVQPALESSYT